MTDATDSARAAILERIRAAISSDHTKACSADYEAIAREYQQSAELDRTALLNVFVERLREYDAQVHEATPASMSAVIRNVFTTHQQQFIIACNGVSQEWLPDGIRWRMETDANIDALNSADGAIATCEVAIAHTGTIVLRGSRTATLLPDRLLCVVYENQVVETVPEAIARLQPYAATALTFISGPSATADIEMTRIRGVHGPRFLDIVLVGEGSESSPIAKDHERGL